MNNQTKETTMRPTVFIGSSTEGLVIANALQQLLEINCLPTVWNQGIFKLGHGNLESLEIQKNAFDFAVFVLTPDDIVISRGEEYQSPRDNILFEIGLFIGAMGSKRVFIVCQDDMRIKIPTDYLGTVIAPFSENPNRNLLGNLGTSYSKILDSISTQNKRTDQETILRRETVKMNKLIEILARSRKVELGVFTKQFKGQFETNDLQQINADLKILDTILNEN